MNKKIAFVGAALAALMVGGTAHAEGGSGYVGLNYNSNDDTDSNAWGVDAVTLLTPNVQVDGSVSKLDDLDATAWNIGGHLFSRNDKWLWGVFAGYDTINADGNDDLNEWTVAGQTQFYLDRITLSADLSYSSVDGVPLTGDITTTQLAG